MNVSFFLNNKFVIHGAGNAGSYSAKLITENGGTVIAFIDDNIEQQGKTINGIEIKRSIAELTKNKKEESIKVLVAMPSAKDDALYRVCDTYTNLNYDVFMLPRLQDLITGKKKLNEVIKYEKILPNNIDVGSLESDYLYDQYKDKVILVTGAAGSIGSELCRQLALMSVKKIIALDISEFGLYKLIQNWDTKEENTPLAHIEPKLGSVCDEEFINYIFNSNKIDFIFHAAAYKHVPLVEKNIIEGVKNNVIGTNIMVNAAKKFNAQRFVLVSTDKAVRPTNIMGASKHVAELITKRASICDENNNQCIFSAVRFGNVVGSSGSVVPLFIEQIKSGGPVCVTSKEITRFFMSINEAVSLVLNTGCFSNNGFVYLLEMGKPVRIYELAERLIIMSGMIPTCEDSKNDKEIKIDFTGLRPGEKLYEELLVNSEAKPTKHPKIYTADDINIQTNSFYALYAKLVESLLSYSQKDVKNLLSKLVSGAKLN